MTQISAILIDDETGEVLGCVVAPEDTGGAFHGYTGFDLTATAPQPPSLGHHVLRFLGHVALGIAADGVKNVLF